MAKILPRLLTTHVGVAIFQQQKWAEAGCEEDLSKDGGYEIGDLSKLRDDTKDKALEIKIVF